MFWLFLVLLSLAQPNHPKLFRLEKLGPEYYRFLNHGFKAGQVTREQAKLKVDILGKVLKKHVTQLRTGEFLFHFENCTTECLGKQSFGILLLL